MAEKKIEKPSTSRPSTSRSWLVGWIPLLVIIVIRIFVTEQYIVPSSSMTPTLITGDIVLIKKYQYHWNRMSIPFGGMLPIFKKGLIFKSPQPGDAVVFVHDDDPKKYYTKRIVGVAGDRVQIINGHLHINGVSCKMEFVSKFQFVNDSDQNEVGEKWRITLPSGTNYCVYRHVTFGEGYTDNTPEYIVPEGCVWVQGDYNSNSLDSFSTERMGPIPVTNLVGKVFFLLYGSNSRKEEVSTFRWLIELPYRIMYALYKTNTKRLFKFVS